MLLGASHSSRGFHSSILPEFSMSQIQQASLLNGFSQGALDGVNLSAMTAGSLAYQLSSIVLPKLFPFRALGALSAEVTVFRAVHRLNESRLAEGQDFFGKEWWSSFVHFACLKTLGHSLPNTSIFMRHAAQSLGMVLGEDITGILDLTHKSQGAWSERLLNAELVNLQLQCGAILLHGMFAGRLQQIQRSFTGQENIRSARTLQRTGQFLPRMSIIDLDLNEYEVSRDVVDRANLLNEDRLRSGIFPWRAVQEADLNALVSAYPDLNPDQKKIFVNNMAAQMNDRSGWPNIFSFLQRLDEFDQAPLVKGLLDHLMKFRSPMLIALQVERALSFFESVGCLHERSQKIALETFGEIAITVFGNESLRQNKGKRVLERMYEFAKTSSHEVRVIIVGTLRKMMQAPVAAAFDPACILGALILEMGYTRDREIIREFYHLGNRPEIASLAGAERELYQEFSGILIRQLAVEEQQAVFDYLWESMGQTGYQRHHVFENIQRLLGEVNSLEVRRSVHQRAETLLGDADQNMQREALTFVKDHTLKFYDTPERARLLRRVLPFLGEREGLLVDLAFDAFRENIGTLGPETEELLERVIREMNRAGHYRFNGDYIKYFAEGIPAALRPRFVDGTWPALRRVLLHTS